MISIWATAWMTYLWGFLGSNCPKLHPKAMKKSPKIKKAWIYLWLRFWTKEPGVSIQSITGDFRTKKHIFIKCLILFSMQLRLKSNKGIAQQHTRFLWLGHCSAMTKSEATRDEKSETIQPWFFTGGAKIRVKLYNQVLIVYRMGQ